MTFACGTCGISMLSAGIPFFGSWVVLLVVGGVIYAWQNTREGTTGVRPLEVAIIGAIAFVGSAIMLAQLIIPALWAWMLYRFASRMRSGDKAVRGTSRLMLVAFVLTACYGLVRMEMQGKDTYLLGRFHAGGPGMAYFQSVAKQDPFPAQHLIEVYRTGDERQATNVLKIFELRPHKLKEPQQVAIEMALVKGMNKLRPSHQTQLDTVLSSYEKQFETVSAPATPTPSP